MLWWLSCLLLLSYPAAASAQYQFDSWSTDNGLPQNAVNAILQTRDGYLWLATADVLRRLTAARRWPLATFFAPREGHARRASVPC